MSAITELANRLEAAVKLDRYGVSFDKIPPTEGEPGGYRFMRKHHVSKPHPSMLRLLEAEFGITDTDAHVADVGPRQVAWVSSSYDEVTCVQSMAADGVILLTHKLPALSEAFNIRGRALSAVLLMDYLSPEKLNALNPKLYTALGRSLLSSNGRMVTLDVTL